jgi:hypothetical protein
LDIGEHGHPHNTHSRSRRTDSAPHGIGVKTKPVARVDLRSSLDPDPLPAVARTEPGNNPNRSQTLRLRGLTRPRSFRDVQRGAYFALNGTDHHSHEEQGQAIGDYVRWRNAETQPKQGFAINSKIRRPDWQANYRAKVSC